MVKVTFDYVGTRKQIDQLAASPKAKEAQAELAALAPDIMVVVAYGLILPAAVLAIPRLGCVNVHGSILPRWRGAAPIQRAIEAGDSETGVTIMQMDEGLDTGPMLKIARCPMALAVSAPGEAGRSSNATVAPAATRRSAVARPSPEAPPVTMALTVRSSIGSSWARILARSQRRGLKPSI